MLFHKFVIIIIFSFFTFDVSAACIGSVPVWGSKDTKASCAEKQAGIKTSPPPRQIQQPIPAPQSQTPQINQGAGSNVFMNGFQTGTSKTKNQTVDSDLILTVHQIRFEIAPYVIPGAYQFDEPGTPANILSPGLAWEYYFNKTVGVGLLWQEFDKSGGKSFNDITHTYTDPSGDSHTATIAKPGDLSHLKYRVIIPYVSVTGKLAPTWALGGRVGIGRVQVEAEYKNSANIEHADNSALLFDLFLEKWYSGMRVGGALRYLNARSDTNDYTKYINLGSAQAIIYVQITLKNLGVL